MNNFTAMVQGRLLYITGSFTNKVTISDTTLKLFTVNLSALGIASIVFTYNVPMWSDGGEAGIMAIMNGSGVVESRDTMPSTQTVSAGNTCYFTIVAMINSFL